MPRKIEFFYRESPISIKPRIIISKGEFVFSPDITAPIASGIWIEDHADLEEENPYMYLIKLIKFKKIKLLSSLVIKKNEIIPSETKRNDDIVFCFSGLPIIFKSNDFNLNIEFINNGEDPSGLTIDPHLHRGKRCIKIMEIILNSFSFNFMSDSDRVHMESVLTEWLVRFLDAPSLESFHYKFSEVVTRFFNYSQGHYGVIS